MRALATGQRAIKAIDQQVLGMEGQYGGTSYLPLYNLQTWTGNAVSPESALNIITGISGLAYWLIVLLALAILL